MTIAGRTQMMSQYSVHDTLGRLKLMGFQGAEICLENEKFDVRADLLDDYVLDAIRDRVVELEMKSVSLSYHANYIADDAAFDLTKKAIIATPRVGAKIFVFSGARQDKLSDPSTQWEVMARRTRELVTVAEDQGVILAKEPEPDFICGTSAELIRLMDQIDSPTLRCNLDLGHSFLCDPDPMEAVRTLGEKIVHGHIENLKRGVHNHRVPQDGDMDLAAYIAALKAVGFDGQLALDLYGYDYEAVAPDAAAYLKALVG